jgi:hypothetical protein
VLAIGLAAHLAARLLPRAGARALAVTGLAIMAAGSLLLASGPAAAGYVTSVLPGLAVLGLGIGLVFPAATVSAMSAIALALAIVALLTVPSARPAAGARVGPH